MYPLMMDPLNHRRLISSNFIHFFDLVMSKDTCQNEFHIVEANRLSQMTFLIVNVVSSTSLIILAGTRLDSLEDPTS